MENAHTADSCSSEDVVYLRETLALGHSTVINLKVGLICSTVLLVNFLFVRFMVYLPLEDHQLMNDLWFLT